MDEEQPKISQEQITFNATPFHGGAMYLWIEAKQ